MQPTVIHRILATTIFAVLLPACATTTPTPKPRLLITVTPSKTAITRHEEVRLTMHIQNIGSVPVDIPDDVSKEGTATINLGAGEWGLMSPNYYFGPAGAVTAESFFAFRLLPGQSRTLRSTFTLSEERYHFPSGRYFADARLRDTALSQRIDLKIIPAIVRLSD